MRREDLINYIPDLQDNVRKNIEDILGYKFKNPEILQHACFPFIVYDDVLRSNPKFEEYEWNGDACLNGWARSHISRLYLNNFEDFIDK